MTLTDRFAAPHRARLALICSALCVLASSATRLHAAPGVQQLVAPLPLEGFLIRPTEDAYGVTGRPILTGRRRFVVESVSILDSETGTLLLYREIGGEPIEVPVVLDIKQFAAYKYRMDRSRIMGGKLGEKTQVRSRRGLGPVNIKIPVKVPKGLSLITGEGTSNIKITGSRRIELSGVSRSTAGQAQTARTRGSPFTVNFEQESQLNVQGTVGDRISIELQQDSRSQRDIGETLRLRYDGDEDGIIEEIEAGSTSLDLPGTRLVGFSAGGRGGLFGIKAKGRLGGLNLTVVTSQDKGSSNRKTFQGQSEETANTIRDFQYLENVYFFLDKSYRDAFPDDPPSRDLVDINSVRVFINDFNDINDIEQRAVPGLAYAFWNSDGTPNIGLSEAQVQGGGKEEGSFHEMDREDFFVDARGYLILNRGRVNPGWALGVAYRTSDGRIFGDISYIPDPGDPDSKVRLKLLKARQQRPEFPTWDLSWRNVYSMGGRQVEPQGFELFVFRDVAGQEPVDNQAGVPYLQIFGLDTHTNGSSQSSPPDNIIDIDGGTNLPGLNLAQGHLVFSDLEPFGQRGVGAEDLDDDARVPEIYNTINHTTRSEKSKFFMVVRSKSRATQYNLGLGIIEGSEEVVLNGRRLVRGQDYIIDYQFGSIRFTGDAEEQASDPAAKLTINYGSKDVLGFGSQKSLLGVRAEHPFKDNFSLIGMTLLYSSQSATGQRVRVGQEPARTVIWDANARFRFTPQSLTDFVNTLPFVATEAPSSLTLDMEVAQSLPNPNTRGVAYIDDFEGAENKQPFSIYKLTWNRASTPTRNGSRISLPQGRLTWYNPVERDRTSLFQIQPNRDDITAEQAIVDILNLRFEPHRTNGFPERTRNNQGGFPEPSWSGLTQYLNGVDLSRSKFIELWVRGNAGKLHIDLGEISERVSLPLDHPVHNPPPPNRLRTEDKPLGGLPTGDNVATVEEDIGLDGLTDAQEDSVFQLAFPANSVPSDPSGDNFTDIDIRADATLDRYPPQVNGTEGNSPERDSTPDSEDLNRNGILDTRDSYVRYSVDLSTNRGLDPTTDTYDGPSVLVDGTVSDPTDRPWRLIRIPLRGRTAPQIQEGTPDTTFASLIDFARLWIEHSDTTTIQIYTMDVAGSDWLEDPTPADQQSGDFKVAVIGTDNAVYESPPGLERETDPATGRRLLERSLALKFEDLYPGESVSASRTFFQEEDYTRYGKLTMFVHGGNPASPTYETNFPALEDTVGGLASPIELFLRFTSISGDTLNFYEYRSGVYQGWAPEANTVEVDLELVSQLKGQFLDLKAAGQASTDSLNLSLKGGEYTARYDKDRNTIEIGSGGRSYIVRGNPALSRIRAFTVGIKNTGDPDLGDPILEGENEIWIDELRVDAIRRKRAMSASLNLNAVLADLGNLTLSMERRSGDFQDLQGRSTGTTTSGIRLDGQLNLDKFLPEAWHMSIPVRVSYNRNSSVPRIRTGSDIVLTSEQKANESDVRSSSRFNLSFRKRPAPEKPTLLARLFFDRINASLNYSTNNTVGGAITRRRSNSTDNLNGNFGYDLNWSTRKPLNIFGWVPLFKPIKEAEFFYLPSNLGYSARFTRNVRDQQSFSAAAGDTSDVIANINETFSLNETYKIKLAPFRSVTADYDLAVDRDLRNGFVLTQLQFGRETRRNQRVAFGFSPRLTRYFTLNTQYSSTYAENLETGGQKTPIGNVRRGLKVNNNNTANVRFSLNLPTIFQPLARPGKGGISLRRIIGKLGSSLDALQTNASRSRSNNLFGLRSRPSLKFQLGLKDTAEVEVFPSGGVTRINTRNITDRAGLNGGLRLPLGLSVQAGANYTHTWTHGNANTEDENIALPTVSAAWRGLERVPILRWVLTSSSVNTSYQDVRIRRGEGGLGPQTLTSDGTKVDYNPLIAWTARWKGQLSTTLRSNRSRQNDLRYQRNIADTSAVQPTLEERLIGTTIDERSALQANLGYTLQFFERLKSNVDIDLGYTTSEELQKEIPRSTSPDEAVEPVIRRHEGIWSASLAAQYQFSSQFTGGARLRHENRKDRLRDLTNRSWEFRLWGEIRFN